MGLMAGEFEAHSVVGAWEFFGRARMCAVLDVLLLTETAVIIPACCAVTAGVLDGLSDGVLNLGRENRLFPTGGQARLGYCVCAFAAIPNLLTPLQTGRELTSPGRAFTAKLYE